MSDDIACCAHSIVMHSSFHVGSGLHTDSWHCCDCGYRFAVAPELPTVVPEKSHLHRSLERVVAENERLREDAERYRWLRERCVGPDGSPFVCVHGTSFFLVNGTITDAAIDAARKGESHE